MEKKHYARAPNSSMWLGKEPSGGWRAFQEFGKAWAFDSQKRAEEAWDEACLQCLERCAKSGDPIPAWSCAKAVILRGHTPEGMPGTFDYYLGIVDGRFVTEKPSGMMLSPDESQAKVFGSLEEAKKMVMSFKTAKSKTLAVLPISCRAEHPVEIDGAKLDALAAASYACRLREEWESLVPLAKTPLQAEDSLRAQEPAGAGEAVKKARAPAVSGSSKACSKKKAQPDVADEERRARKKGRL
jgi:hypothetical protein